MNINSINENRTYTQQTDSLKQNAGTELAKQAQAEETPSVISDYFTQISENSPDQSTVSQETSKKSESSKNEPASEKTAEKSSGKKKWTILYYSAADCNLEPAMVSDIADIESAAHQYKDMNIVVQMDRGPKPSEVSGKWMGARRFKIENDKTPDNIDSPVLDYMGQINMSDPKTLENFMVWGMKKFPAENYMLIVSDHGLGWYGVAEDEFPKPDFMTITKFRSAIDAAEKKVGEKLSVIGIDACLMGQVEVAYELRHSADYLVASEESEGSDGWPYTKLFKDPIFENVLDPASDKPNIKPEELSRAVVRHSSEDKKSLPTMGVIDLSKMDNVAEKTDKLAKAILDTDTHPAILRSAMEDAQSFNIFRDYYDVCEMFVKSHDIKDKNLKNAAKEAMQSVKDAVVEKEFDEKKFYAAEGLSININKYKMSPKNRKEYEKLQMGRDTQWDEATEKIAKYKRKNPNLKKKKTS